MQKFLMGVVFITSCWFTEYLIETKSYGTLLLFIGLLSLGFIFPYIKDTKKKGPAYQIRVKNKADKFIKKYRMDGSLRLIPLCAMAVMYDPKYPYIREMYREFCALHPDVQYQILKSRRFRWLFDDYDGPYEKCLSEFFEGVAKEYSGDDGIFCENAKYINMAMTDFARFGAPEVWCKADEAYKKRQARGWEPEGEWMPLSDHIGNLFAGKIKGVKSPMKELMRTPCFFDDEREDTFENGQMFIKTNICCIAARKIATMNTDARHTNKKTNEYPGDKLMEDRFLETYLEIYNCVKHTKEPCEAKSKSAGEKSTISRT